jgi:PAS domain S-box-containing protein
VKLNISWLPLLLAIVLSMLGVGVFYLIHQSITRTQLIELEQQNISDALLEQHSLLESYLMRQDWAGLKNWVSLKAESRKNQAVLVIDPQGQIIAADRLVLEETSLAAHDSSLFKQLEQIAVPHTIQTIRLSSPDPYQLTLALPLEFGSQHGFLVLRTDLTPALSRGFAIAMQHMVVYLVSMLLSGVLLLVILQRILHQRLRQLEQALTQYSDGDHQARACVNDNNEFGALEQLLNHTFDTLNGQRQQNERARQFNELVLASTTDGIISANNRGHILRVNQAALQIFGYSKADELLGQDLNLLIPAHLRKPHQQHFSALTTQAPETAHVLNRLRQVEGLRKDGSLVPLDITITSAEWQGEPLFIAFLKDNSAQRQYQRSIEQLAFQDAMTGVFNLNGLKRQQQLVAQSWLYLVNVDGMALLNQSFGFDSGDRLIKACCQLLQRQLTAGCTLARSQGAEFVLLSDEAPELMLPQLQRLQGQELRLETFNFKLSFCVTFQRLAPSGALDLTLHNAEQMMRHAKQAGRGSMLAVEPAMLTQLQFNARLCHQLEQAIRDELLFFYYQPKFAADSRQPVGAEALIRWQADGQWVSPAVFIPLAEQSHLMPQLDRLVIRSACRQIRQWLDRGLLVLPLSINLSAHYLMDDTTIAYIFEKVGEYDVPAHLLEIEVTEYSLIHDEQHTADNMLRLQKAGIGIAIDDYGTGHSNLATVLSLPVQNLKIDQSFIRTGMRTSKGRAILENILQLAKSLQVTTTAEGVETEEQLAFLQQSGCQFIQGYLLSKPLPLADYELLLHRQTL